MKTKKDRVYSELEKEVRSIGRKKLSDTDFLVWDEKRDCVRFESNKVSKTDNSRNYAIKSLERRSYRPLQDGEDLEDYMSEFEDTQEVSNNKEDIDFIDEVSPELLEEKWLDVVGYEGYYKVSDRGRVANSKGNILVPVNRDRNSKYLCVTLCKRGSKSSYYVHRLVGEAFIYNDNPKEKTTINHKDQDTYNNCVDNLEWLSLGDNVRYSRNKKVLQYDLSTGELIAEFPSTKEASKVTGTSISSISSVCNGKYKKANGYRWKYAY